MGGMPRMGQHVQLFWRGKSLTFYVNVQPNNSFGGNNYVKLFIWGIAPGPPLVSAWHNPRVNAKAWKPLKHCNDIQEQKKLHRVQFIVS